MHLESRKREQWVGWELSASVRRYGWARGSLCLASPGAAGTPTAQRRWEQKRDWSCVVGTRSQIIHCQWTSCQPIQRSQLLIANCTLKQITVRGIVEPSYIPVSAAWLSICKIYICLRNLMFSIYSPGQETCVPLIRVKDWGKADTLLDLCCRNSTSYSCHVL